MVSMKKIGFFLVFVAAVIVLLFLIKYEGDVPAVIDAIKGYFG